MDKSNSSLSTTTTPTTTSATEATVTEAEPLEMAPSVSMDMSVTTDSSMNETPNPSGGVSFYGEMSNTSFLDDSNSASKTSSSCLEQPQLTHLVPAQNSPTYFVPNESSQSSQYFVPASTSASAMPVMGTTQAPTTESEIKTSSIGPAFLPVDEVLPSEEIFQRNSVFVEPKNPTTTVLAGGTANTTSTSSTVSKSYGSSTEVINAAYQAAQNTKVPMAFMDLTKNEDNVPNVGETTTSNANEPQKNNPTFFVEAKNYVNNMKNTGSFVGGEIRDPNNPDAPSIYPCPICYHFFTTPTEMANHLETEHRKFQCDICKKLMSHKRNVDRHRRSVHENQRGFGCPMCPYRSAHKQVVQRHLVTKHQIKREESPAIPYHAPPLVKEENRGNFDIKPHPFLHHPYYANPPWLNHHDYQATYFHHQQIQSHYNNNLNMNNNMGVGQMNQQTQPMTAIKPELEIQQVNNKITTVIEDPMPVTITTANEGDDTLIKTEDKKPPLTAQVSFEDQHVRIVFQRNSNIHVVEVPFPEI